MLSLNGNSRLIESVMRIPAAFLDRDGVINEDSGYVKDWESFHFLPGAIEGMRLLNEVGLSLIIVTNQSGIARGYYTEQDFHVLMARVSEKLLEEGVQVTHIYYCPHLPDATVPEYKKVCDCRKPRPGMIQRAAREHDLDLQGSIMVGDKMSDMQAAESAGIPERYLITSDFSEIAAYGASSLLQVAHAVQKKKRK